MNEVTHGAPRDGAAVLTEVCAALSSNLTHDAAAILRAKYPFQSLRNAGRQYSPKHCMTVFVRDGFVDRYSGKSLVFPGTMRLLARLLPTEFPFHGNWRMDACHSAFYELFPTIDHVVPISRGGADADANWVSTSMLRNSAKANYTLDELGWTLQPRGCIKDWDGLSNWFLDQARRDPTILDDRYLRQWHGAAHALLNEVATGC